MATSRPDTPSSATLRAAQQTADEASQFRFAPSFHPEEDAGSLLPGEFEAQYLQLFADALGDGPIGEQARERLNAAASELGLDPERAEQLERGLLAAYEAQTDIADSQRSPRMSLVDQAEVEAPPLAAEREAMLPTPPTQPAVVVTHPITREPVLHARYAEAKVCGDVDLMFRVAGVLMQRGGATVEQSDLFAKLRPVSPLRPTHPLDARAWDEQLIHPDQDATMRGIFSVIASAALLVRISAISRERSLPELDPEDRQDPRTSTVSVVRAMAWTGATLAVQAPAMYLAPRQDFGFEILPTWPPAVRIGGRMLSGKSALELAFHCARHLTWFRADQFVCSLVSSLSHLEQLFFAALSIGAPRLGIDPSIRQTISVVRGALMPALSETQLAKLRDLVGRYLDQPKRSMRRWARGAELTACRAGLLQCGDIAVASSIVGREKNGSERVKALEEFWVSDDCGLLRRKLGVTLG